MAIRLCVWNCLDVQLSNDAAIPQYNTASLGAWAAPLLIYQGTVANSAFFTGVIPDTYGGGNTKLRLYWRALTTLNVRWQARIVGVANDESLNITWPAYITTTATETASGDLNIAEFVFASGTYPLTAGDLLLLQLNRDGADAGDTSGSAAQVLALELLE